MGPTAGLLTPDAAEATRLHAALAARKAFPGMVDPKPRRRVR